MNRFRAALRWDMTLQFRHGFYHVGVLVAAVWVVLLRQLPGAPLDLLLPAFLFNGMTVTTFYFVAALVLLEKGEGTLAGLIVTPLRDAEYLLAKVVSLTLLATVESLAVVLLVVYGARFNLLPLLAGIVGLAVLYTLVGFLAIVHYDSINEYVLPSVVLLALLMIPLLDHLGLWRSPLVLLHPAQPALLLMRAAFMPVTAWQLAYGLVGTVAWNALTFIAARRRFARFVVRTVGGRL